MAAAIAGAVGQAQSGASIDAAQKKVWDATAAAVKQAVEAVNAEERRRQLKLDTPAEYDKVPKACGEAAFQQLLRASVE